MLFNSFSYLVFFAVIVCFYFCVPHKVRWVLLLCASYYFYMCWNPALIILIIISTAMNFMVSIWIDKEKQEGRRKRLLIWSLFGNFGLLFFFKYLVFFYDSALAALGLFGFLAPEREFDIILPMGISFYTFQAASYTIDVYRRKIRPVRNYGMFSLYISFFPQLVAGPIERSENLLPQFYEKHAFQLARMVYGLKIMLWGFFKKVVIADRSAILVNTVFNQAERYWGLPLLLAGVLFAFQLYCDFSGYSDIAVGSAKVLGFDIMANFHNPYFSTSIKEFWRRWHISLSTWFQDYVYIPLGGSRAGKAKQCRNLFITFLVSGLWHGANWTYVIWGGIHGIYQVAGLLTGRLRKGLHLLDSPLHKAVSGAFTFFLVVLAFVFFRANTVSDGLYILSHMFRNVTGWADKNYLYQSVTSLGVNLAELLALFLAILFLMLSEAACGKRLVYECVEERSFCIRFLFYLVVAVSILTLGVYYNAGEFIYFQF